MLTIRMQRTGRSGHAMFRVVVQDARRTPTSGKIVAAIGSYDPHSKSSTIDKEKVEFYLSHGAQPSERVVKLLTSEKVKLPGWVKKPMKQSGKTKNPEKYAKDARTEPTEPAPAEEVVPAGDVAIEAPEEETTPEATTEETKPDDKEPAGEDAKEPGEEPAPAEEASSQPEEKDEEPETKSEEPPTEEKAEEPPKE